MIRVATCIRHDTCVKYVRYVLLAHDNIVQKMSMSEAQFLPCCLEARFLLEEGGVLVTLFCT